MPTRSALDRPAVRETADTVADIASRQRQERDQARHSLVLAASQNYLRW
jgi:hypothetical protein